MNHYFEVLRLMLLLWLAVGQFLRATDTRGHHD